MDNLKQPWQCELVVHTFNLSDVSDPDLWAADSLSKFEHSEKGKWIMKHSRPVAIWKRIPCDYGWQYQVRAYLAPEQVTYYKLKYE